MLRNRGHEVAFATGRQFDGWLGAHGLRRIPRTERDGDSFHVDNWVDPTRVGLQLKHLVYALKQFSPDVLITSSLAFGPYLVAEASGLPLAVLGFATWLLPRRPEPHEPWDGIRMSRYQDWLRYYNVSRALCGMRPVSSVPPQTPMLGDLFLLRSIPELEGDDSLPPQVRFVGACQWEGAPEPNAVRELEAFVARAGASRPFVYVQQGRTFRDRGFWPALVQAFVERELVLLCDVGRMDDAVDSIPSNFFVRPHLSMELALPRCSAVITSGSTSPALGALLAGLPAVMIPSGSGTEDIVERWVARGLAVALEPHSVSPESLRAALERVLTDREMQARTRAMAGALAAFDDFGCAAELLVGLGGSAAERPRATNHDSSTSASPPAGTPTSARVSVGASEPSS